MRLKKSMWKCNTHFYYFNSTDWLLITTFDRCCFGAKLSFLNGPSLASFSNINTILQQINEKNIHLIFDARDSNSQPLQHVSPPITTRYTRDHFVSITLFAFVIAGELRAAKLSGSKSLTLHLLLTT